MTLYGLNKEEEDLSSKLLERLKSVEVANTISEVVSYLTVKWVQKPRFRPLAHFVHTDVLSLKMMAGNSIECGRKLHVDIQTVMRSNLLVFQESAS